LILVGTFATTPAGAWISTLESACLDQANSLFASLSEARCKHAAGGAGPNDDIFKVLLAHGGLPVWRFERKLCCGRVAKAEGAFASNSASCAFRKIELVF
jgi:hypothetical protein